MFSKAPSLKEFLNLVRGSYELAARHAFKEPEMILDQPILQRMQQMFPEKMRFTKSPIAKNTVDFKRPWPQPSLMHPDRDAPTVLTFPDDESTEFAAKILYRYAKQICVDWIDAAQDTLANPKLDVVSNEDFSSYFKNTVYANFLNPVLDKKDVEIFGSIMTPDKEYLKVDFSPIEFLQNLEGQYSTPTISLYSKNKSEIQCEAIFINGLLVKPENKNAWQLAKYFVLQNGSISLTILAHPRVHFPMDTINAVTKALLPEGHLIYEILKPHMWLTLPLNRRVQWSEHSIVSNRQDLCYTPFPSTGVSNYFFKSISFCGIKGNSSYPEYVYPYKFNKTDTAFNQRLKAYYDVIYDFTVKVCKNIPQDSNIKLWASHISQLIKGFPNEDLIFKKDNLARALAFYIFDVSVMHAAEHFSFSSIPVRKASMRLRVPPPANLEIAAIDLKKLATPIDIFRQLMAHRMFFKPNNLTLLKDTSYDLPPALQMYVKEFKDSLRRVDDHIRSEHFIPLKEISASIQY